MRQLTALSMLASTSLLPQAMTTVTRALSHQLVLRRPSPLGRPRSVMSVPTSPISGLASTSLPPASISYPPGLDLTQPSTPSPALPWHPPIPLVSWRISFPSIHTPLSTLLHTPSFLRGSTH